MFIKYLFNVKHYIYKLLTRFNECLHVHWIIIIIGLSCSLNIVHDNKNSNILVAIYVTFF